MIRPIQVAAAVGRLADKSKPNPPRARTNVCEQDSAGCNWFSHPVRDDRGGDDQKVALPIYAVLSGHILLPVLDLRFHSRFARKREDAVQMIRHEQTQAAMPDKLLVVVFHG